MDSMSYQNRLAPSPARYAPHVRQMMGDALVAVDAGLFAVEKIAFVQLVTAGAELLGVGQFERGVEAAPEDHASDKARDHEHAETEDRTRPEQHVDQLKHEIPGPTNQPGTRSRFGGLSRAHRRPP